MCSFDRIVNLLAGKCICLAFEHLQKSLSAGIHHACFLQDRKHLRSLFQDFLRPSDNFFYHFSKAGIRIFFQHLHRAFRSASGYRKDGSLFWFHNSLVSRLHCLLQGSGKYSRCDLFFLTDYFREPAEKLRKDNAGVSARSAQRTG